MSGISDTINRNTFLEVSMLARIRLEDIQTAQHLRSLQQMTLRKGAERLLASAQQVVVEVSP